MEPKKSLSLRVSPDTLDRLDEIAGRLGVTRSSVAASILMDAAPAYQRVASVASSNVGTALLMLGGVMSGDDELMKAARGIDQARNTLKAKEKTNHEPRTA